MLILDCCILALLLFTMFYCRNLHSTLKQLITQKQDFQALITSFTTHLYTAEKHLRFLQDQCHQSQTRLQSSIEASYHVMNELQFLIHQKNETPKEYMYADSKNMLPSLSREDTQKDEITLSAFSLKHKQQIEEALRRKQENKKEGSNYNA